MLVFFFFFKQKTAYEMRISDWSSDVCSSDLPAAPASIIAGLRLSRQRPDRAIQRPSDAHAPPARSWHGAARFGAARLDSGQAARSVALPATPVLYALALRRTRLSAALSQPPTDPGGPHRKGVG